jgi:spermidine synthase
VKHARTVLIGGLGLGFSLRATLDLLGPRGKVVVAEQPSSVVDWNRVHVGGLAGRPLEDPRVTLRVGDVRERIGEARAVYDLILLDVEHVVFVAVKTAPAPPAAGRRPHRRAM